MAEDAEAMLFEPSPRRVEQAEVLEGSAGEDDGARLSAQAAAAAAATVSWKAAAISASSRPATSAR